MRIGSRSGALELYVDDGSIEALFPGKNHTRTKFTYQMSDHLPLWAEFRIDFADDYLRGLQTS